MSIVQIPKDVDIPTNAATGVSKGKQTSRGRQRIEIKTIREKNKKHVTFSKRRKGLFKKASELCVLCGADVAVVTFSEAGKAFSFGHPNADSVIARYLHGTSFSGSSSSSRSDSMSSATAGDYALMLHKYNEDYEHLKWEIKRRISTAIVPSGQTNDSSNSGDENNNNGSLIWWDEPVEGLELHELEQYAVSLDELRNKVASRAEELGLSNDQRIVITTDNSNGDCNHNNNNDDNNTAKVEVQDNVKECVDYSQIFENDEGLSFMNHHLTGTMDAASANGFGVPHDLFPLQYNSAARG